MRLTTLAEKLGCELRGDGSVEIRGVAPIETAATGDLTFVANPRYERWLAQTKASAVVLATDFREVEIPSLRTPEPYLVFARAIELYHRPPEWPLGIHPTAVVAPSARIGENASIGPFVVVGDRVRIGAGARIASHVAIYADVEIGDRFLAHAHVTVREGVRIGNGVTLQAGVVVGSDGFGYVGTSDGRIHKIVQAGTVLLEDDVEIGANATVDRATVGVTVIRRSAKLDNLVMIAHGCEVGEGAMLAAQVGLSGSTRVGRYVRMGGQAGAAGHMTIGDGAQVAAQAGVANSVAPGQVVGGTPAVEMSLWRRLSVAAPRLPQLLRRVRRLEQSLGIEREDAKT
jgi:UDP-3-O-[3-hydroxymyristoyl] glucosamine N-acyltransferase